MGVRRPELVVAAAIVLLLPSLPSLLDGGLSLAAGAIRLAVALALCWGAGAIIERVVDSYSRQVRQAETIHLIEEARARMHGLGHDRQSDDHPPSPASNQQRPSDH